MTRSTPMITIERMNHQEADIIADLMHTVISSTALYNERARQAELSKYTPETLRGLIAENPDFVLVAKDGMHLIGFCVANEDAETVWLAWYGVHQDWRGHRIGQTLLHEHIARMRKYKFNKIWCDSRADNTTSIALLHAAGFRDLCYLAGHWYGQDYMLFELMLDDA